MKELQVTSQDAKQRLDKYLKRMFPEMGTSFLYKMLRKKNITLNGKKATGSEQVLSGDLIQCFFSDETFDKFAGIASAGAGDSVLDDNNLGNKKMLSDKDSYLEYKNAFDTLSDIAVIYEDEHILLLNKPAGVLSQKAKPEDLSLNEWMIGYLLDSKAVTENSLRRFKPSICNRLDRNTSGLVICGKTLLGSREMSRILKDRSLQKYYRTFVHGKMDGVETLTAYHKKDAKNNQAEICFSVTESKKKEYDEIITAYRSIEAKDKYSYLEIELITGKTHQIRAHLSAYGHPIAGDAKYGEKQNKVTMKGNAAKKETAQFKLGGGYPQYQLLHAYRIVFPILEGDLTYLSTQEFVCEEPLAFSQFRQNYFE